jgi:hypothetical protein
MQTGKIRTCGDASGLRPGYRDGPQQAWTPRISPGFSDSLSSFWCLAAAGTAEPGPGHQNDAAVHRSIIRGPHGRLDLDLRAVSAERRVRNDPPRLACGPWRPATSRRPVDQVDAAREIVAPRPSGEPLTCQRPLPESVWAMIRLSLVRRLTMPRPVGCRARGQENDGGIERFAGPALSANSPGYRRSREGDGPNTVRRRRDSLAGESPSVRWPRHSRRRYKPNSQESRSPRAMAAG